MTRIVPGAGKMDVPGAGKPTVRNLTTNAAVVCGGPIIVRPGLSIERLTSVRKRARILSLLLGNADGLTVPAIAERLRLEPVTVEHLLNTLTLECIAIEERKGADGWRVALDIDEWRETGWHAGAGLPMVVERRKHVTKRDTPEVRAARDADIRRRYAAGEGTAQIAMAVGMSRARVWQVAVRGGASRAA